MSEREGRGDKAAKAMGAYALVMVLAGAVCYGVNTILAQRMPPMHPLPLSAATMIAASVLVVPVLGYFYAQTGHMLPVAGGAKAIRAKLFLEAEGVDSVFSLHFLRVMYDWAWTSLRWWFTSRALIAATAWPMRISFRKETSAS